MQAEIAALKANMALQAKQRRKLNVKMSQEMKQDHKQKTEALRAQAIQAGCVEEDHRHMYPEKTRLSIALTLRDCPPEDAMRAGDLANFRDQ